MNYRRLEYLVGASIAIVSLCAYIATLCPTVSFIDSGELATDVYTLGIPHPTGYPFFALAGHVFSHLPLSLRVIYQLNLMAAIFCAAGLFFFFRFILFSLAVRGKEGFVEPPPNASIVNRDHVLKLFIPAAAAATILAFSETYWSQALAIEVYSIHLFFLSVILFFFSRTIVGDFLERSGGGKIKHRGAYSLAFAFSLGLAFTNHMTTILLAPAFLVAFFSANGYREVGTWKKIRRMILPFLLGLSVYLYLPVRASMKPMMNWGNPVDLERFLWHISGKVYRVWIFSSFESAGRQFNYFLNSLPGEFAYLPLLFAVIGIWHLYRSHRKGLIFTAILFLTCVGYSINYDIHDIDSYFLLAYMTVAIWIGFGILLLMERLRENGKLLAVAAALICLFVGFENYPRVNERSSTIVEEYTKDMLNSIAPDGLVVSFQWDYFVSAAYYFQIVEHFRPDVTVIDKELLRRTWYLDQLEARYPALMHQSRNEADAYRAELNKFERGLQYTPGVIEYRYAQFIRSLFERNIGTRPVYVTPEIESQYSQGFVKAPSGLAFRLYRESGYHRPPEPVYSLKAPERIDKYVEGIISFYAQSYLNYGIYSNLHGNKEEARVFISKSLEIKPEYEEAMAWRDRLNSP